MERAQSIIDMRWLLALARDTTSAVFSALAHTVPVKRKAILEIPTSDIRSLTPRQHRLQQKARQRYATPGHNSATYPGDQHCYYETVLFARRAHQEQRIDAREPTTHTKLQIRSKDVMAQGDGDGRLKQCCSFVALKPRGQMLTRLWTAVF
jgi:hypothetical protein